MLHFKKLVEDEIVLNRKTIWSVVLQSAYGPRVEVLAIVLSDQRSAQKLWEMARDNPTDEFFGRLAEQYSVEPVSSSNLGKVPPIRKFGGQPAIEMEAFGLKPGELSGIIATGGKYLILRCQGFTKPVVTDPLLLFEMNWCVISLTKDPESKRWQIVSKRLSTNQKLIIFLM